MKAGRLAFRFTSSLVRLGSGMGFHILPVPDEIAAAWKKAKIRRLVGTINGHPVNRGLQNHADGGSFFIVGRDLIKAAGIPARGEVVLALAPDPAPDQMEMPAEFQAALDQDEAARARWATFLPGRRRSLLSYITSAKTEATRLKRAVEMARKIATHALYGDGQKQRGKN